MREYIEWGYRKVRAWVKMYDDTAWDSDDRLRAHTIKNLLPHAHATPYVFYGSPSTFMTYIADLRVKPGGHMAYRLLTHAWAQEIANKHPVWSKLVPPKPTFSKEEFLDRS